MMQFTQSYLTQLQLIRRAGFFAGYSHLSDQELSEYLSVWYQFWSEDPNRSLPELESLRQCNVENPSMETIETSRELQLYQILALDSNRSLFFDLVNFWADKAPEYSFEFVLETLNSLTAISNQIFQPEGIEEVCEGLICFHWQGQDYHLAIAGNCDDVVTLAAQLNEILRSSGYQYYSINLWPDVEIVFLSESERQDLIDADGLTVHEDYLALDEVMDQPFYQIVPGQVESIENDQAIVKLCSETWEWGTVKLATHYLPQGIAQGLPISVVCQYYYPLADEDEPRTSSNEIITLDECSIIAILPKLAGAISYYYPHGMIQIHEDPSPQSTPPESNALDDFDDSSDNADPPLTPIQPIMAGSLNETDLSKTRCLQTQAKDDLQLLSRCQMVYWIEFQNLCDDVETLLAVNSVQLKTESYQYKIRSIRTDFVQHMAIASGSGLKSYVLLFKLVPEQGHTNFLTRFYESIEPTCEAPLDGTYEIHEFRPPVGYH
jgi:hypothetical protein